MFYKKYGKVNSNKEDKTRYQDFDYEIGLNRWQIVKYQKMEAKSIRFPKGGICFTKETDRLSS